jgi:hypothetical protein
VAAANMDVHRGPVPMPDSSSQPAASSRGLPTVLPLPLPLAPPGPRQSPAVHMGGITVNPPGTGRFRLAPMVPPQDLR